MKTWTIENEKTCVLAEYDAYQAKHKYISNVESMAFGAELLESPYEGYTPFTVWCEKCGFNLPIHIDAQMDKDADALLGFSQCLIKIFLNIKATVFSSMQTYVLKDYAFVGTKIDGFVRREDGQILGLKVVISEQVAEWDEDKIPWKYWNEIQHSLLVTGLAHFVVVVKVGEEIHVRCIEADADYQDKLLSKMVDFWALVREGIQPDKAHVDCEKPYDEKLQAFIADVIKTKTEKQYNVYS